MSCCPFVLSFLWRFLLSASSFSLQAAVAAAGRLAAALKTIGADPASFGAVEAAAAADEAVAVERGALEVVAGFYGEVAAAESLDYLAGLADCSAL